MSHRSHGRRRPPSDAELLQHATHPVIPKDACVAGALLGVLALGLALILRGLV